MGNNIEENNSSHANMSPFTLIQTLFFKSSSYFERFKYKTGNFQSAIVVSFCDDAVKMCQLYLSRAHLKTKIQIKRSRCSLI